MVASSSTASDSWAIQPLRTADQHVGKFGINALIMGTVCIGQCGSRHSAPKAGAVQLWPHGTQADFDVAQAFAERKVGKGQAQKLTTAREFSQTTVARIPAGAVVEIASGEKIEKLCGHELTVEHNTPPGHFGEKRMPQPGRNGIPISSRVQQ